MQKGRFPPLETALHDFLYRSELPFVRNQSLSERPLFDFCLSIAWFFRSIRVHLMSSQAFVA